MRVFKWHISISLPNRIDSDSNQLLLDACAVTGVQPPWNSPKIVWTIAWNIQKNMLPILHKFDACKLQDNCVNLSVLWWKALDFEQDERVAYDMLPPLTRAVVAFPLSLLYPRLHHQNVAIRTKYLDDKLKSEISMPLSRQAVTERPDRMGKRFVQVVSLGGGFDTRALRLGSKLGVSQWMEADLPSVIAQKQLLLEKRFLERRGHGARGVRSIRDSLPILIEADLNQFRPFLSRLDSALAEVNGFIANSDSEDDSAIIIMAKQYVYI